MREILNKLHLSIREFAELYEIPYQTVRQWTVGERRMPEYLKKLIKKDIERNTKGEQLTLEKNLIEKCNKILDQKYSVTRNIRISRNDKHVEIRYRNHEPKGPFIEYGTKKEGACYLLNSIKDLNKAIEWFEKV